MKVEHKYNLYIKAKENMTKNKNKNELRESSTPWWCSTNVVAYGT